MPRPHRQQEAGGVYHVTARGNRRQPIFVTDRDREFFVALLERVIARMKWRCLAYCLMGNHFHLALETPEPNLAEGMRRLNGVYAQDFNQRHRLSGHLFQGRYGSTAITREAHLLEVVRYIALNPVRARFCDAPADYRWSSHAALAGVRDDPLVAVDRALAYFGAWGGDGQERYLVYVDDAADLAQALAKTAASDARGGVAERVGPPR